MGERGRRRGSRSRRATVAVLVAAGALVIAVSALALDFSERDYPAGTDNIGVVAGDFNRDGKQDLIAIDDGSPHSYFLKGRRNGHFHDAQEIDTPGASWDGVAGRFDGNRRLDLVIADQTNDALVLLRGRGNGTFKAPRSFPVGDRPQAPDAGDFNRDGRLDLAVADRADSTVSVLINKGRGKFRPARDYTVDGGAADPYEVTVARLNGGRKPDIAVADANDETISILLAKRNGKFRPSRTVHVGKEVEGIASADFNRDGKQDLALGLIFDDQVGVLLGKGNGKFRPARFLAGPSRSWRLDTGRFNGDRKPDIAVGSEDTPGSVSVFLGKGHRGKFKPEKSFPTSDDIGGIAVGDFDRRRHQDIAGASEDSMVSVLLNKG